MRIQDVSYHGKWTWDSPHDGDTAYQRLSEEELEELYDAGIENEGDYIEYIKELNQ